MNVGRENYQVCLYTAFKSAYPWAKSWVQTQSAGITGATLLEIFGCGTQPQLAFSKVMWYISGTEL